MGRRVNGEGSIYKRANGSWAGQVYVTLVNGEKKRVYVSAKSYEGARAKLRELINQENRSLPHTEKEWKVKEYLDYWLSFQKKRVRETTMIMYDSIANKHLKPVVGGHGLKTLSVADVRNALDILEQKGCSGRTQQKCLQVLVSCLKSAMREELVQRNVAQLVERPKYIPRETVMWTPEQAATFLRVIKDHPQFVAFLMLLAYGMRRGEVLGLRYQDIDFDNGTIHVRQQINRINGRIVAADLKTRNSRRTLPLIPAIRTALLEHAEKRGVTIPPFKSYIELSTCGTVVVSNVGTPLEPRNLERCFHLLTKKAGLPRIKIHAMRHMAATALKDLNVPVKDAQLILGHADITTTLNIYQHGSVDTHRSAISAMGNRLLVRPKTV